jgi:hypothetical protein
VARSLLQGLCTAITAYKVYAHDHPELTSSLCNLQPKLVMDEFLLRDREQRKGRLRIFDETSDLQKNPLDGVPSDVVVDWCNEDPAVRFPLAASAVTFIDTRKENDRPIWTEIAERLLSSAPDRKAVLDRFIERFEPTMWSGSRATIMAMRAELLKSLFDDRDPALADYAAQQHRRIAEVAAGERNSERDRDMERDEGFE